MTTTYLQRRSELKTYFDETAADAWARLTSNDPVSRIRQSVRRGRDAMRGIVLDWLPIDLDGMTLLDAGCGTGALSIRLAARGAEVTGVELAPRMLELAAERSPPHLLGTQLQFSSGDMLDPSYGTFDYVVAMDSLIHYESDDVVESLAQLLDRTRRSIVFTVAPRTPALTFKHALGRLFPRTQRAPAIVPVLIPELLTRIEQDSRFGAWAVARHMRVNTRFYTSEAFELVRL